MARKPKDANREAQRSELMLDEQALVEGIYKDEYILVVGSGAILDHSRPEFAACRGDINSYIIGEINRDQREARPGFTDYRNFTDIYQDTPLSAQDPIYTLLSDDFDYDIKDMSPELVRLLRSKLLKFVFTTTIDGYLETLMRDIWGDKLNVVNIEDSNSLKDFQNKLKKSRINKFAEPTLFYVFGRVVPGRPKPREFVETDIDAIKVIEKWMKLEQAGQEQIVPFLRKKRLLAVGCKFDDWYFRFFWYILTRTFGDEGREGRSMTTDNLVAVFDPASQSDDSLKEYLKRIGVCIQEDVWTYMDRLNYLLTSTDRDNPFRRYIFNKRREGGIFISYKSCDERRATELFCKLSDENGFDVWFDNNSLNGGDEYRKVINEAIRQSRIFVPILSPSIAADIRKRLEEGETSPLPFYMREWEWACSYSSMNILPVSIGNYDTRSPENEYFQKKVGRETTCIPLDVDEEDYRSSMLTGYAKLVDSIKQQLELLEE